MFLGWANVIVTVIVIVGWAGLSGHQRPEANTTLLGWAVLIATIIVIVGWAERPPTGRG